MLRATLFLCLPILVAASDLSGDWHLQLNRFGESFAAARVTLKEESGKVTGTLNELKLEGTLDGSHLVLKATRNGRPWGMLDGTVEGDSITGEAKQERDTTQFSARRAPKPSGSPRTHTFEPDKFHRVFWGGIPPALHISPGDTVKTTTVDAGGTDHKGVRRSLGGNPETGPFYVDGAMPGDTLVIKFARIRLNRDTAGSGDRIVPGAVDPWYFRDAKFDDKFDSNWKLDLAGGTASLAKPTDRLKNFKVALRPMLGCVGVAPPQKQAMQAGSLGPWGGNMDYNGLREGVTVYLPVFQEGAILFVGDGHAVQGDGELNGDALETSMEVEFTVDLVRGHRTESPRFEDAEFLMASGIGGSLPEALQQATTELARWLERDYKLSANESNIVLGTSIRYDIAELVDPQIHVVAKVSKSLLATLK